MKLLQWLEATPLRRKVFSLFIKYLRKGDYVYADESSNREPDITGDWSDKAYADLEIRRPGT